MVDWGGRGRRWVYEFGVVDLWSPRLCVLSTMLFTLKYEGSDLLRLVNGFLRTVESNKINLSYSREFI